MAEEEELIETQNEVYDDSVHQAVYIFNPATDGDTASARPTKKRKVNGTQSTTEYTFPPLLNGEESDLYAQLRQNLFREFWNSKQTKIDEALNQVDADVLERFTNFVQAAGKPSASGKISTGLLVSGSDGNAQRRLLHRWQRRSNSQKSEVLIQLQPSHCSSLQICLKNIIKLAIGEAAGSDAYNTFLTKHKRLIPMNFDLELLQEFVQEHGLSKVVVSILDGETFDMSMIMEIISTLHCWVDRIPFVLVIGLATTVELFESRLANHALKVLDAQVFELSSPAGDPLYQVFDICQTSDDNSLFLGPVPVMTLFEMTQNQGATVEAFIRAVKYIYMSHFFSNPLSVLLSTTFRNTSKNPKSTHALCKAIRSTDSFHNRCEDLLDSSTDKEARNKVRLLLENDDSLLQETANAIQTGQSAYLQIISVISALTDLRHKLDHTSSTNETRFETSKQLYQLLASSEPDFSTCSVYTRDILPALRKLRSQPLLDLLESLNSKSLELLELSAILEDLRAFQSNLPASNQSVRSENDPSLSSAMANGLTSKSPSKLKSSAASSPKLDKHEKQYTSIVAKLIKNLENSTNISKVTSFDLSTALLSEAYIFNLQQPLYSSVIFPRPRYSIERALSRPGDYLSCGHDVCTEATTSDNTGALPPTVSVLYNLLQEAPTVINVRDLFDAFCSRLSMSEDVEDENRDGESGEEKTLMALFYRSLADLKLLGLVKSSANTSVKKKALVNTTDGGAGDVDFIAKTSWFGL